MNRVRISASKSYDVIIGSGFVFDEAPALIKECIGGGKAAVITDSNVNALYGAKMRESLEQAGIKYEMLVVPAGEKSKSGKTYLSVLEKLAEGEYTRSDVVVAFGGGVIGDLAGFVAATYLRGVKLVQIPTTLLSFVDSSVGGKTAINLSAGKNLAGAFYQPEAVLCDYDFAGTLPPREVACGMAEIIKYGMIFDESLLRLLESGMDKHAIEVIVRCVELKKLVVERDERDNGERQLLNFGHTLGHAVEKESGYRYSHGQAVAYGMQMITRAAERVRDCKSGTAERLDALCAKYDLDTDCRYSKEKLLVHTGVDKKRKGNGITAVIPAFAGKCFLKKMTVDEWKEYVLD